MLEKYWSCVLRPRIGPGELSVRCLAVRMMETRWSGRWMLGGLVTSGGLHSECQEDAYVSPLGRNQVAWVYEAFRE